MAEAGLYNKDELNAPEWMNIEFFEKILRETEKDDSLKVHNLLTKPGSKLGDHYASVMFRAVIAYSTKTSTDLEITLIIKTMPFVEGAKKDMLDGMGIFDTEIKMYTSVIPKFEETLRSAGDYTQLGAKCLYSSFEPQEVLIFEDLTKKNYITVDNFSGNWNIAKKAIEKLAKWHAVSYKLVKEGNTDLLKFEKGFFGDKKLREIPMFRDGYKLFIDMLKTNTEFVEYVPKFERLFAKDHITQAQQLFRAVSNGCDNIFVLNHGDFHIKNIMFTEKNHGEIDDVMLIDFQICIWGPAANDLIYMLYTFLDNESRINRRDELIYYYFSNFTKTLRKLQYSGQFPKLTDLYKDLITYKDFELLLATTFLPFTVREGTLDPDQAMNNEDYRQSFYKNPKLIEEVRPLLKYFLHRGFLD